MKYKTRRNFIRNNSPNIQPSTRYLSRPQYYIHNIYSHNKTIHSLFCCGWSSVLAWFMHAIKIHRVATKQATQQNHTEAFSMECLLDSRVYTFISQQKSSTFKQQNMQYTNTVVPFASKLLYEHLLISLSYSSFIRLKCARCYNTSLHQ